MPHSHDLERDEIGCFYCGHDDCDGRLRCTGRLFMRGEHQDDRIEGAMESDGMKTHCVPPRQHCAACRAEVRASQMTEREWRRLLWRFERGSKIANTAAFGLGGALAHRIVHVMRAHEDPAKFGGALEVLWEWRWWIGTEALLLAMAILAAWWCAPKMWDFNENERYWEEHPEYTAAKVCREQHEKAIWKKDVLELQAKEAARKEVEIQ